MRPELETYEQIDSFLNGELKGEALNSFQERMQKDLDFAEEVQLQKFANEVVAGASFQDLRDQMSADISKIDATNTSSRWKYISVGLGFIALSSTILYFSPLTEKTKAEHTSSTKDQTSVQKVEGVRAAEKINMNNIHLDKNEPNKKNATKQFDPTDSTLIHQSDVAQRIKDSISAPASKQIESKQSKDSSTSSLKKEIINPVTNPCLNVSIAASITTTASCIDKNTGSITIQQSDIKGGKAPYTIRLDKSRILTNSNTFINLTANTYSISITDQLGCTKTYSAEVAEKECNPTSSIFAPDKGEVWKFTGTAGLSYTLTIVNIAGQQVFRTAQLEGTFEWQGYSQKGEYLDAGLYIYVAEYSDGSKENGQVTIAR